MKKRTIISSAILGALLAALPSVAQAQPVPTLPPSQLTPGTYTFDGAITNAASPTGVQIGADILRSSTKNVTTILPDGTVSPSIVATGGEGGFGSTYDFVTNNASITLNQAANDPTVGLYSTDYKGIYTLSNITVNASAAAGNNWVAGMNIYGTVANESQDPADAEHLLDGETFTGIIDGKDIVVTSNTTGTGVAGDTYGIRFALDVPANTAGNTTAVSYVTNIGGSVKFNDISVNAQGTGKGALAVSVGDILEGGSMTINSVDVTGNSHAVGLHLITPETPTAGERGTLTITEKLAATSHVGDATGVLVRNSQGTPAPRDSHINMVLNEVVVDSSAGNGNAVGVSGKNLSNVTLKGNVTSTAALGRHGYGINAETAKVAIDGQVMMTATTAGFKTTGTATGDTLAITVNEGAKLTSNFEAANDFALGGNGDVEVVGANTIGGELKTLDAVTVDFSKLITDGSNNTLTFAGNGAAATKAASFEGESVAYFGDLTDDQLAVATSLFDGVMFSAGSADHVDSGIFGAAIVDGNGKLTFTRAESVNINDGFLAAYTIHNRYTTWNAVRDHMISGNGNRGGILGQECDPCADVVDCDPCDPRFNGFAGSIARNAWVNYVARSDEYQSSFNRRNWNLSTEGVQVGTDLYRTKHNQLGMLFGYEGGRMRNAADLIKSEDIYVGIYGAHVFRNGWDVRGSFAYGWQDYDMTRSANLSSFKGRTSESTIEIGKRLGAGAWSLRPVFAVDVYNNNLKAASEGTSNGQMSYAKDSLTQVYLRSGTDLRYQARRFALNSGVYYSYDLHNQALSAMVSGTNNGVTATLPLVGSKLGRELLTFNLGADIAVAKNFSIFGGYQGQSLLDSDNDAFQSVGYIGANWKW